MTAESLFTEGVISLRTWLGLERALGKEARLTAEDLRLQAAMAEAGKNPLLRGQKTTADLRRAWALVNIDEAMNAARLALHQGQAALQEQVEADEARLEMLLAQADARKDKANTEEWEALMDSLQEARDLLRKHANRAEAAEKLLDMTNW